MSSNNIQSKTTTIYIDDAPARDAYDRLSKKADQYNDKIKETEKKAETLKKSIEKALDSGKSPERFQKRLESVNATLDKNRQALSKVTKQQADLQKQIDGKTAPSIRQMESYVRKLDNEVKNLATGTDAYKRKLDELGRASQNLQVLKAEINQVKQAQDQVGKTNPFSQVGTFLRGSLLSAGVIGAIGGFTGLLKSSIDEALDAEEASARLEAQLDNLGRSDAFDRINESADRMAEKFRYLDNDDVVGVFEKLIDYGKLTENQMNQLLPVIIDFSAKQRISLEESTSVIVKAMEGNGKALKQYGIDIKDAGTESERFSTIMGTLKEKVDGAAEAFEGTTKGQLAVMQQQFANLKEELGQRLLPALTTFFSVVNKVLGGLSLIAQRTKNAFNDAYTFLSEGAGATLAQRIARQVEQENKDIAEAAAAYVQKQSDKSLAEVEKQRQDAQAALDFKSRQLAGAKKYGLKDGRYTQEEVDGLEKDIKRLKSLVPEYLKLEDQMKNQETLGINPGSSEVKPKKDSKAEQERKKRLEDQKRLNEELAKLELERQLAQMNEFEREIARAEAKYEELRKLAHGNADQLKAIDEALNAEIRAITDKFYKQLQERGKKFQEQLAKDLDGYVQTSVKNASASLRALEDRLSAGQAKAQRDKMAKLELDVMKSNGLKKLKALQEQLDAQESLELQNKDLTENEKLLIEEKYNEKRVQNLMNFLQQAYDFIRAGYDIYMELQSLSQQAQANREQAELDRLAKRNDREKSAYEKLLRNKLISQQAYNQKAKALDDQYNQQAASMKKKQFERQQKADISRAIMDGAGAILVALKTQPFVLGLALAAIAAVKTKKQIDVIKSQPVPEFADGGQLRGPLHSQGGMPVMDPRSGRKVAEVEGGEVILSRRTVRNNRALVGALLDSSMRRRGATVAPFLQSRPYMAFDYGAVTRSVRRVRHYENGGVFEAPSPVEQTAAAPAATGGGLSPEQDQLLAALLKQLQQPPKAYVVFSEIEAAQDKMNQIKDDATFR